MNPTKPKTLPPPKTEEKKHFHLVMPASLWNEMLETQGLASREVTQFILDAIREKMTRENLKQRKWGGEDES